MEMIKNTFNKDEILELCKIFGQPKIIETYSDNINSIKDLKRIIDKERIERFEIVGTWGKTMTWELGLKNSFHNSGGIVFVTW